MWPGRRNQSFGSFDLDVGLAPGMTVEQSTSLELGHAECVPKVLLLTMSSQVRAVGVAGLESRLPPDLPEAFGT